MTNDDGWALLLGGLIGAGLASPNPQQKQVDDQYRQYFQQVNLRSQKLGELPRLELLKMKEKFYSVFIESYKMHIHGFFRGATILATSLIEAILKERFGTKKLKDLIDEAKEAKLITVGEFHYLHGIRHERNNVVHEVFNEVSEDDSALIMRITIKLLNKVLSWQN